MRRVKALALLLAAGAAPAGANPAAIGEALALCIDVVEAQSRAPLDEAGLNMLAPNTLSPPQWSARYRSPAGIGEILAERGAQEAEGLPAEVSCTLHLPAANGSAAMRWEKLGLGPVMALESKGFAQNGGSYVSPKLARCTGTDTPIYVSFTHNETKQAVVARMSNRPDDGQDPC
ncbi:hypothetical protein FHY55_20135 [Oceanicola sp. D3]|uniref:hypothetical protein n=1 Tax=Oceanicola sp. D3 TaxID=2587163 RepID=UPI001124BAEA|nr:hypothetical protein [Oceanicola sp. D3]QDC11396.1 hypothetical protein FHY55_20135 [Oceanicola sp. D3]